MKKNKQTAVDWLVKEFNLESYKATIALVKEMEKQQIILAYHNGCSDQLSIPNRGYKPEKYYNKTYDKSNSQAKQR